MIRRAGSPVSPKTGFDGTGHRKLC